MPASFGIAETDDYVRKILTRAGQLPKKASAEQLAAFLTPHVVYQESRGNPNAVSPKGAKGRMQVMDATNRDPGFGVKPAQDDSQGERERVGQEYLLAMVKRYPGRADLALAAYNAGPGRADKWARQGKASVQGAPLFRASAGVENLTPVAASLGELPEGGESAARRGNFFSNVVGRDSSIAAIARMHEDAGVEFDYDFNLTQLPTKEWDAVTEGIPEEYWESLGSAGSRAHLDLLANRLRTTLQAEEELAAYGGWGIAGRFALNMLDPLSVALGVATGGIGVGTQATRLARAAAAARTSGNFAAGGTALRALEAIAKGSAWQGAGRAAVLAGTENAALEAFLNTGDATRNGWDVALAGVGGAVLGAGASRVFTGRELRRVQTLYLNERSRLEIAELNHKLDTRQTELTARLAELTETRRGLADNDAGVGSAKDAIEQIQRELREAATARRVALTQTAAGALKRSELGTLRRSTEGLRKQAREASDLESQVEARMLREDIESLGEDVALSKGHAKLRKGAAKQEVRARQETIRSNLERAETAFARANAAEDGRREIRKLEKAKAKGEPLLMLDEPGRNKFAERELAATEDLKRALGLQEERLKAVDTQRLDVEAKIRGVEEARAAGVRASDESLLKEARGFGEDTLSAARFTGFDEGVHPTLEGRAEELGLPEIGRMKLAGAVRHGPLATFSGILRGSENGTVRKLLGPLVGSSTGTEGGQRTLVGASEVHARIHESMTAKFYAAVTPAYKDWAERNGVGLIDRQTRGVRNRFMSEVGLHVRGQASEDSAVTKAAGRIRAVFADYLRQAKEAGVKGFEEVELQDRYLPRVFDFRRLREIEQDIGTDSLRILVARAIQATNEDIDDALAGRLSKAYVDRMKELRVGSDAHLLQGVKWDDVGFLRRFLSESGVGSEEIEDIVNKFATLNVSRARQTEGSFRYAKKRAQFDENFAMKFRSQVASKAGRIEDVEVRMSNLFENNVEALFGRYSRTVSGHIGLAQVGIRSRGDFDERLDIVRRELNDDKPALDEVVETAEVAYKLITGQPIQNANKLTKLGRAARDYNFTTTMNQAGFAQFPDLAGLIGKGYLKYTFSNFFDAGRTFRRVDGSIDDAFYREQEEVLGLGTDYYNNATFSSFDPGEEPGLVGVFGAAEHGLRVAGRGTQAVSGMAFITSFAQRLAGRVIVQRLVKDVMDGGAFSPERAATLGLDDALKGRIATQIKAHTEFVNGDFGGKVRIVNYMKWTDVEARDTMLTAVFREARRIVQEEDLGDTTKWMHTNWGKLIAQFRRFALVSYSRQLLHGIAHADAEEATRLALSMVIAATAYKARHEIKLAAMVAGGMSDEDAEEYRKKYLSWDRLAAASWANSSYSSLTPALYDSTVGAAIGERFFDTRTSGLGSDFITGSPTFSTFKNLTRAGQGIAQSIVRGDRQFDQGDSRALRKLIPYQNVIGMDGLFQALTADLPEKDEDLDPEAIDWFLQD